LLIGFIIGRIVGKLAYRVLHEIELNSVLTKAGAKFGLEKAISNFAAYFIYFITIIWALNTIGITAPILNMISAALLILIIISIILAIKDSVPNMIAGLVIYRKGIIKEGNKIKIDNISGIVKKISLVETDIESDTGDVIHMPNSIITKKEIIVRK
jgi:small-conductance mechanosensitive channel